MSKWRVVGWIATSWGEPIMWRRAAIVLVTSLLLGAACLRLRFGLLALCVPALLALPWPTRVSVAPNGVTLASSFVRQTIPFAALTGVRVAGDPRRWSWPRRPVLMLERGEQSPIVVFGAGPTLEELEREITSRLVESRGAS